MEPPSAHSPVGQSEPRRGGLGPLFRLDRIPVWPYEQTLLWIVGAGYFLLDDAQVAAVGEGAKRFPAVATVNGYTWRTTVTRMGGEFLLGLNRAVRPEAGLEAGETVELELQLDSAPREVEVPPDLAVALAGDQAANAAFENLAYTNRKEYASWVLEAKREDTCRRRITQALEMLREGRTRS